MNCVGDAVKNEYNLTYGTLKQWINFYMEPTKEEEYKFSPDGKYALTQRNTIICMACNFEQSNYRKKCWKCGAEFVDFGSFGE